MKKSQWIAFSFLVMLSAVSAHASEKIYGYTVGPKGIYFQVYTGGCTGRGNFEIKRKDMRGYSGLELVRIEPDRCRAFLRGGIPVFFAYEELGTRVGQPFLVLNELISSLQQ